MLTDTVNVYIIPLFVIMDIFVTGLCVLGVMCALIYKRSTHPGCRDPEFSKFKMTYLVVYLLATGILGRVPKRRRAV